MASVAAAAAVLAALVPAAPVAAQASYVTVSVHTDPATPEPGDDVSVTVRVASCPPGTSVVELLLADAGADAEADDSTTATVMAEAAARTTLLWRTRAVLELHSAIEGWYGARVRCGTFVPDHVPMANTYFAVGANPTKTAALSASQVVEGGTLRFEGNGCPGPTVEYDVSEYTGRTNPFVPTGTIPTRPDGTWAGDVSFPPGLTAGRVTVSARCAVRNQFGETVYVSYGQPLGVTLLPAPATTPAAR
jgi:hypothetical protein